MAAQYRHGRRCGEASMGIGEVVEAQARWWYGKTGGGTGMRRWRCRHEHGAMRARCGCSRDLGAGTGDGDARAGAA